MHYLLFCRALRVFETVLCRPCVPRLYHTYTYHGKMSLFVLSFLAAKPRIRGFRRRPSSVGRGEQVRTSLVSWSCMRVEMQAQST